MALTTYTFAEWVDRARAVIRGKIPEAVTTRGSDYYLTARLLALLATNAQSMALYILRQILPKTAEAEWVLRHAEARKMALLPATKATGYVQIAGTAGSTQGAGSEVTTSDGQVYTLDALASLSTPGFAGKTVGAGSGTLRLVILPDVSSMSAGQQFTISIDGTPYRRTIRDVVSGANAIDLYEALPSAPAAGTAIAAAAGARAAVTCSAVGSRGNRDIGETGTLGSPGAGVTASVVFLGASGGADVETLEELRARIVDFDAWRPAAGNAAFYRELARSITTHRIADAFVFPGFRGLGTVDVIPWGPSGARMPSASMIAAVQSAIDAAAHWADDVVVKAFTYTSPMACYLLVGWHPGHEPDWVGSAVVGGGVSTTTRVYLTQDPIAVLGIEVGDRITLSVQVSGTWQWAERTVSAVTSTYIDVDSPLPAAPPNATIVYPGGPGVSDLHAALVSYFDERGPAAWELLVGLKVEAGVLRVPSVSEKADGAVRLDALRSACLAVPGVASVTISHLNGTNSPTNDVRPASQTVPLLGEVQISSFAGF